MQTFHDRLSLAVEAEDAYMEGLGRLQSVRVDQMGVLNTAESWYDWPPKATETLA